MLGGIISGLIVAWILTCANADQIFAEVLQPFVTNIQLTTAHYYFAFALIGLIGGALRR